MPLSRLLRRELTGNVEKGCKYIDLKFKTGGNMLSGGRRLLMCLLCNQPPIVLDVPLPGAGWAIDEIRRIQGNQRKSSIQRG